MHPRNRYKKKPDFGELAKVRPSLKPFLIHKSKQPANPRSDEHPSTDATKAPTNLSTSSMTCSPNESKEREHPSLDLVYPLDAGALEHHSEKFAYTLDFSNPAALRELTCAALESDFGLKVEIPLDRLIPAVPQRLNYIHWIEDLLLCGEGDDKMEGVARGDDRMEGVAHGDDRMEGVAHGDKVEGMACGDKIEGVAHGDRMEGMAGVMVPKGESIVGIDIGTVVIQCLHDYVHCERIFSISTLQYTHCTLDQ